MPVRLTALIATMAALLVGGTTAAPATAREPAHHPGDYYSAADRAAIRAAARDWVAADPRRQALLPGLENSAWLSEPVMAAIGRDVLVDASCRQVSPEGDADDMSLWTRAFFDLDSSGVSLEAFSLLMPKKLFDAGMHINAQRLVWGLKGGDRFIRCDPPSSVDGPTATNDRNIPADAEPGEALMARSFITFHMYRDEAVRRQSTFAAEYQALKDSPKYFYMSVIFHEGVHTWWASDSVTYPLSQCAWAFVAAGDPDEFDKAETKGVIEDCQRVSNSTALRLDEAVWAYDLAVVRLHATGEPGDFHLPLEMVSPYVAAIEGKPKARGHSLVFYTAYLVAILSELRLGDLDGARARLESAKSHLADADVICLSRETATTAACTFTVDTPADYSTVWRGTGRITDANRNDRKGLNSFTGGFAWRLKLRGLPMPN